MERQELLLTIEKALSEVLERPVSGLTEETALFDELQLTSLAVLGMLMSVEEATGISVDPEGLDIDDLRTLGSFADYVEAAIREEETREEETRTEETRTDETRTDETRTEETRTEEIRKEEGTS
ncbi:acyl carrier protein [Streptomyces cyaneofuscatus]|uniref:acyl carrier protein n=1 Tax=Streptomyces cyaneofuscatus TaxID=66883 RepID=UPI0037F86C4C